MAEELVQVGRAARRVGPNLGGRPPAAASKEALVGLDLPVVREWEVVEGGGRR